MKTLKLLSILFIATLASCSSVRVNADYDKKATFTTLKFKGKIMYKILIQDKCKCFLNRELT